MRERPVCRQAGTVESRTGFEKIENVEAPKKNPENKFRDLELELFFS